MEKLLHERLGEPDTELCIGEMLELIVTGKTEDCTGRICGQCIVDAMNALADEIERTYTPNGNLDEIFADWIERMAKGGVEFPKIREAIDKWCLWRPRFEDGEPVGWYEYFVTDTGIASRLTTLRLDWAITDGSIDYLLNPVAVEDEDSLMLEAGEFVKRPTLKVYDADGAPCKINDEVWSTSKEGVYEEGDMMIVVGIDAGVKERQVLVRRALGGAGEVWVNADALTHERPVFDAEGVRICKGDTVWDKSGNRWIVVDLNSPCHPGYVSVSENGDEPLTDYPHESLTRREPDSIQKQLDRLNDWCEKHSYSNAEGDEFIRSVRDHISAIIERGA